MRNANKRLRKKLEDNGYKSEIAEKIVEFYTNHKNSRGRIVSDEV